MADYSNRTKYEMGDSIQGFPYLGNEHFFINPNGRVIIKATFRCFCGNEFIARVNSIESKMASSCGCIKKAQSKKRFTKHGQSNSITYSSWEAMKSRCYNCNNVGYKDYGARGITVCDKWKNSFEAFLEDMGERPDKKYTLDRINPNGNYEPGNCRWANKFEQSRNKRATINVEYKGRIQCLTDWARELGMSEKVVLSRVSQSGWDPIKALETPIGSYKKSGNFKNPTNVQDN